MYKIAKYAALGLGVIGVILWIALSPIPIRLPTC